MNLIGSLISYFRYGGIWRIKSKFRSYTDRQALVLNNFFVLFCSLYHAMVGMTIVVFFNHNFRDSTEVLVTGGEERHTGTQTYLSQACIGGYLTLISVMGIRAAQKVNIRILIWYYWLSLVAIPLLFLFSVASLDFKELLRKWVSLRWHEREYDFLRKFFCVDVSVDCTLL